jgi:hypothetical protein
MPFLDPRVGLLSELKKWLFLGVIFEAKKYLFLGSKME